MYRHLLASDEHEPAAVRTISEENNTASVTPASPARDTRLSSRSGTSTGSDSNGPSDDVAPVFDSNGNGVVRSAAHVTMSQTDSAPPVPPPRRSGIRHAGFAEVWQRHAGAVPRPATDVVQRRALAAGPPSSTPKSCPTSPLLDGGAAVRRSDGRRTHDRQAPATAGRGLASAPVSRRTRLPVSPLARTLPQPDVR